jgi:hypothetical protein
MSTSSRSATRAPGPLCAEAGTRAAAPFPAPLSPLAASFLRCAPDRFLLTKPNTSCTIEVTASLRSEVFGIIPECRSDSSRIQRSNFAGIPEGQAQDRRYRYVDLTLPCFRMFPLTIPATSARAIRLHHEGGSRRWPCLVRVGDPPRGQINATPSGRSNARPPRGVPTFRWPVIQTLSCS